jgi:hypothetical protein
MPKQPPKNEAKQNKQLSNLAEVGVVRARRVNVDGPLVQTAARVQAAHHQAGPLRLADDHDARVVVLVLLQSRELAAAGGREAEQVAR